MLGNSVPARLFTSQAERAYKLHPVLLTSLVEEERAAIRRCGRTHAGSESRRARRFDAGTRV